MLLIHEIKNLVFSGGGQRGFAYVGALKELEAKGIVFSKLHGFGGTSIGALFGLLLCAGYTPAEMEHEMYVLDIHKIIDFNITTLFQDYGLDNGRRLQKLLIKYLKHKHFHGGVTFQEMYELTGVRLVLIGCNINTYEEYMMSHETTPTMRVVDACHMSMSLPLLFSPMKHNNALYVDGGIINNFPMQYFPATSTLGFRLNWGVAFQIGSMDQFFARLAYCALGQSEYIQWIKLEEAHKLNTITIEVGDVSTVNLHMSNPHKELIVNTGRLSVCKAIPQSAQPPTSKVGLREAEPTLQSTTPRWSVHQNATMEDANLLTQTILGQLISSVRCEISSEAALRSGAHCGVASGEAEARPRK